MTRILVWRDTWELGIPELDREHQAMVRLLNRLIVIAASNAAERAVTDCQTVLAELISELRNHFQREERFLEAIGYPRRYDHQREHAIQTAEFVDMRRALAGRPPACLDEDAVLGIKTWFFNHVVVEDRMFAEYYFRVFGRPPGPGAPVP